MNEGDLKQNGLARIRAVALDVDGVLTDGGLWWGPGGEEWKRFCFADIMGLSLARRAGLELALISGENSPLVDRYAEKLHIPFVAKGTRDKVSALGDFAARHGVSLECTCFFGDDVNDLPAMEVAGVCACPSNAAAEVLAYVVGRNGFVSPHAGGLGAVRSLTDAILVARELRGRDVFQLRPPE